MYLYFIIAFVLSITLTPVLRAVFQRFHIVDAPQVVARKIHKKRIPLGGGVAIFLSFFLVAWIAVMVGALGSDVSVRTIVGLFLSGLILMIGGILDDRFVFRPRQQIWFPFLAILVSLTFGLGPHEITNPFGGIWNLDQWMIPFPGIGNIVILADALVFCWLMGMMYTTKLLDGLDGLVTGMVGIGAIMIFFLTRQGQWFQPEVSVLALIFAGTCFGFLIWNKHPAKIFLGEGGSLFAGFILGSLAIISGGKIAVTMFVIAIPMLDIVRVAVRRLQRNQSMFIGDREHLHYKLLGLGLSHTQTVYLFYSIALLFGTIALFLQSAQKLLALIFLIILMLMIGIWFSKKDANEF